MCLLLAHGLHQVSVLASKRKKFGRPWFKDAEDAGTLAELAPKLSPLTNWH